MSSAFGRYRLLDRLGQGGMAEVFKAKSYGVEGFEKVLVIKRILPELSCRQDFVDMFIHEAKLAVRLSHANIVQVFDLGKAPSGESTGPTQPDAYYIAMEYVHGLDLASVLARCRRRQIALPIEMSIYVASEIAKGLDHAHRRRDERGRPLGIVHRDVSPQNVLLSFEGEVKVTDFGVAKARGALDNDAPEDTRAKRLQGKFGYMSPEQSRGESVDARSDLFSLGVIVYECVTGVNPFSAPTTFETLRRVQACEYPPLSLLRPDAPPELIALLKSVMGKNPEDRYPDAGRTYEALLAFLYGRGRRYGAHDLAEFLARFRDSDGVRLGAAPEAMLETQAGNQQPECTPIEAPLARATSCGQIATGPKSIAADRAAEMGERRDVTALVVELSRHTSSEVGDKAATMIERWGGHVLRREVGHIAALFGLVDPDGRDTEMATRCALVTLRSLEPSHPPGVGLHVGRIHVSSAGEPTDDERLGSLIDTARDLARMRDGQAAMSTRAMRQVKALFEFEPLSDSDQPATHVPALRVREVRGPAESLGRFVGRKEELRRIGVVLALAAKRRPRVMTIRGDHGVGKTRLLLEVERRLRKGAYDVGFHIATCPPRGDGFPLSGVVSMLHVLCGTAEGDSTDRVLALEPRLRALGLHGDEVQALLMALGAGVTTVVGDASALLCHAMTRMVQSLCGDRPHTFAWDVAHAMDDDSFALLAEVLRHCGQTRMVFAFAARPGFSHVLEKSEGHVGIDLGDLPSTDVERLVAQRLGVDSVPADLLQFVLERAGGHPLFVVELVKALVDGGTVSVAERRVVSTKALGQDLALPNTLRGLVASRVARLSTVEKATLQAAAVLGDPIDLAVLSNMTGQGMPALERSITVIAARDFVVHAGPAELRFTSPLVREVVVDALTPEGARGMHAAAGRALEETLGERAWEHPARIAGHLAEAGECERAAGYYARSSERRLAMRQLEAAARDCARAITLADPAVRSTEDLVTWLERLASAVRLVRVSPGAKELCDSVIDHADRSGAHDARVRARVAAGHVLAAVSQIENSRARLAEVAGIEDVQPQHLRPVLLAEVDLAISQGNLRRALLLLREVLAIARASSDAQEEHRLELHLAQAHAGSGDRATALVNLQKAERLLPHDQTAAFERARAHAMVDYLTREFRSAALQSEEAINLAREVGLVHQVMLNLQHLGHVLVHLDDLPRAHGAVQESFALCGAPGNERAANFNRMLLAFLDGIRETADGEKLLRQGIAYAECKQLTWDVVGGRVLLAKLLRRLGRLVTARSEYEAARDLALKAGHRLVADDCARALDELDAVKMVAPMTSSTA